jgi:hypothetical protein
VDSLKALDPRRPIREADIALQQIYSFDHLIGAGDGGAELFPQYRHFFSRLAP